VSPARVPVNGGAIILKGIGFAPGLTVSVGNTGAPLLSTSAGQMLAAASAQSDGTQTISINDPVSGAFSIMTNAITFGAAATDQIVLLPGVHPPTPVETQATNPVMVRVFASDGVTPVNGATVGWTTTNGAILSACGGASACSAISDESGMATTWVTPGAIGNAVITATLAPGVYNPDKSVSTALTATSSATDIGVTTPYLWIASGASLSVPLTARVVGLGSPKSGVTVNFAVMQGTGSLSAASAVTDSSGYATVGLTLTNFSSAVQVSACVSPGNNPCQTIFGNPVAASLVSLQAVGGGGQLVTGLGLQPMLVRVIDFSTPPNGVLGETVLFQATVLRPVENDLTQITSELSATPIILSESQFSVQSDVNGLATFVPSLGSFTGPLAIEIQVSAGAAATLQGQMGIFPAGTGGNSSAPARSPWHRGARAFREAWWEPGIEDPRIEDRRIDDR
jgi:hypothetical protein